MADRVLSELADQRDRLLTNLPGDVHAVLAATAKQHIAYVPYFPLGGFSPLLSDVLESSPSGSARPRRRSPSPGCYSTRRI
jgi:hypothetical protein